MTCTEECNVLSKIKLNGNSIKELSFIYSVRLKRCLSHPVDGHVHSRVNRWDEYTLRLRNPVYYVYLTMIYTRVLEFSHCLIFISVNVSGSFRPFQAIPWPSTVMLYCPFKLLLWQALYHQAPVCLTAQLTRRWRSRSLSFVLNSLPAWYLRLSPEISFQLIDINLHSSFDKSFVCSSTQNIYCIVRTLCASSDEKGSLIGESD